MKSTFGGVRIHPGTRCVLALALGLVAGLPAAAADITVAGDCDLVEAVFNANFDGSSGSPEPDCAAGDPAGADTIHLTADVSLTAALAGFPDSALAVTSVIHLEGNGYTIERASSSPRFRLFEVTNAGDLTLEGVVVSRGRDDRGGGVFNDGGVVTIRGSQLKRHRATSGSPNRGGAIFNQGGTVAIVDSTLSGNDAVATASDNGQGGAIYTTANGTVSVTNSTLSNNTATDGATTQGDGGAIAINGGMLTIANSTLSGNVAGATGGAIWAASGSTVIYDSTIAGNSPGDDSIQALLLNTLPPSCVERVSLLNTIVDPVEAGGCGCTIIDGGNSFGCGTAVTDLDPALRDNGGPSSTHALLAGSNAIDVAGDCAAIDPLLALDQRGAPRFDGNCDAGAFEFGGCPILGLNQPVVLGSSYEECEIRLGEDFSVFGAGGELTLTAGSQVVFENGAEIGLLVAGVVTIAFDPQLQVTSALEAAEKAGFRKPR